MSHADDYSFDYTFYLDGALETTVRASGYIQSAYYAKNGDYGARSLSKGEVQNLILTVNIGYHIHDGLSGSMHDHVLTFKVRIMRIRLDNL